MRRRRVGGSCGSLPKNLRRTATADPIFQPTFPISRYERCPGVVIDTLASALFESTVYSGSDPLGAAETRGTLSRRGR